MLQPPLLRPGRGENMGSGWETARNPNRPPVLARDEETGFVKMPGVFDWCVLRLGAQAQAIEELRIDTHHFRGNYPESVIVEACNEPNTSSKALLTMGATLGDQTSLPAVDWKTLLTRTRLGPNAEHVFKAGVDFDGAGIGEVTHVRVSIFPDGGLMRVRAIGKAARALPETSPDDIMG